MDIEKSHMINLIEQKSNLLSGSKPKLSICDVSEDSSPECWSPES